MVEIRKHDVFLFFLNHGFAGWGCGLHAPGRSDTSSWAAYGPALLACRVPAYYLGFYGRCSTAPLHMGSRSQ